MGPCEAGEDKGLGSAWTSYSLIPGTSSSQISLFLSPFPLMMVISSKNFCGFLENKIVSLSYPALVL